MTGRTVQLVDVYCKAANLRRALDGVEAEKRRAGDRGPYSGEIAHELKTWGRQFAKQRARLSAINAELTEAEKNWVRRKCAGDRLAIGFIEVGIYPSWVDL